MILNEYVEMREDKLPLNRSFLSECDKAMFDRLRFETAIDVERFERQLNVINYEYAEACYYEQMQPVNELAMKPSVRISQFFKRIGAAIKEIFKKIGEFFSKLKELGKRKQKEGAKKASENEARIKEAEKKQEEKPAPPEEKTFKGSSAYWFLKSMIGQAGHAMGTKNTGTAIDDIVDSTEKMLCLTELEANTKAVNTLVKYIDGIGEDESAAKEIGRIHAELIKVRDEYRIGVAEEADPKRVRYLLRVFQSALGMFLIPSNGNLGSNMIKIPSFEVAEPKADSKWGRSYINAANKSVVNFYAAYKKGFEDYIESGFSNKNETIKVSDGVEMAAKAKAYDSTAYTDTIKGTFVEHIAALEKRFKPIEAEGNALVSLLNGDLGDKIDRIDDKHNIKIANDTQYGSVTTEIQNVVNNFARSCSLVLQLLSNITSNNLEIISMYSSLAARAKSTLAEELKAAKADA